MNIVCVICADRLTPSDDVFYTPCGHIFHFPCVTQWLERSRTCPQCREKVTQSKIHRIYFNFSNNDTIVEDATSLQAMVDSLKFQLLVKERETKQALTKNDTSKKETAGLRAEVRKLENELTHKDTAILALKEQTRFFKDQSMEAENAKKEVVRLKKKLDEFRSVQMLINGPNEAADDIIFSTRDPDSLLTYIKVMKSELTTSVARRKELRASLKKLQQEVTKVSMERNFLCDEHEKRKHLEETLAITESEKYALEKRLREYETGTSGENSKNVSNRMAVNAKSANATFDIDDDINMKIIRDIDEPACSLKKTSDVINLCDDSPIDRKMRSLKRNAIVISPTDEHIRGNEENSPLSGHKYNISGELSKRKTKHISGASLYSLLAKKPRLGQAVSAGHPSNDMTYDGFGGHSRNDKFPSPKRYNRDVKKASHAVTKMKKRNLADDNNRKLDDFVNLDNTS